MGEARWVEGLAGAVNSPGPDEDFATGSDEGQSLGLTAVYHADVELFQRILAANAAQGPHIEQGAKRCIAGAGDGRPTEDHLTALLQDGVEADEGGQRFGRPLALSEGIPAIEQN